jgi:hypothetical protein
MDIAGTEVLTLTNSAMTLKGTTPTLTIGDAGAEDTKIVFDGNAQDFYIGLDDSADDLIIGKGSTVGTTPAIVIDENQKVGIGDTPDLAALHVKTADSGASADSGADEFVLENSGDTGMTILSGTTSSGSIRFGDSEDNDNGIIIYNHGSTPYMRFFSNGSEAVRILNNQHLIAGTTTEYTGTVGNITAARQIDIGADDANLKTLFFNRNAAEGEIGGIASGITGFSTMGRINFVAENVSGGTQASSIRFKVTNSANEREVLRITEDGNFRPAIDAGFAGHSDIGTTSFRFEDAFIRDGVTTGSDRNEKENITESDLGLTFIKELNPVSYSWKNNTSNRTHYGLIAQDIETWLSDNGKNNTDFAALIKEDISEEQDGSNYKYGLRYTEFVSPLIKAIQEQQVIIEDLKARITTLEGG